MIKYKLLLVVLVAHHESNDEVFIKVGIEPGRDPEFAEGKNVILSTTCRLGGIIMVDRTFRQTVENSAGLWLWLGKPFSAKTDEFLHIV